MRRSIEDLNKSFNSGRSSASSDNGKYDNRFLRPEPTVLFRSDPAPDKREPFVREKGLKYDNLSPSTSEDAKREARSSSNAFAFQIKNSPKFHDISVVLIDDDKELAARDSFVEKNKRQGREAYKTEQDQAIEEENLRKKWTQRREKDKKGKEVLVFPNRPGMAAALAVGQTVVSHSSVKGLGALKRHPAVQEALDKLGKVEYNKAGKKTRTVRTDRYGEPVGKLEDWHGMCAEVGAVSDYLVKIDPLEKMDVKEARTHFESKGAVIFAHRPEKSDGTAATDFTAEEAACGSCTFMLTELSIKHKLEAMPSRK